MGAMHQALLGVTPSAGGATGLPASDDFNRANDAATLNTSSSGHIWAAHVGTWGIDSNQGYLPSPVTDSVVTVEVSAADVTAQVTLAIVGNRPGLSFRFVDTNNYWAWFRVGGLGYICAKRVAGTWTTEHTEAMATANGDIIKVITNGTSIELYVNGSLKTTLTGQTDHQAATKHGLYHEAGGTEAGRWEDLSIT